MDPNPNGLADLIDGVKLGLREAQKALYERYYSYAKSVCLQYSSSEMEAVEILNDGFLKILTNIELYDPEYSFKGWLRKIMINKSIDYYRKFQNKNFTYATDDVHLNIPGEDDFPDLDAIEDLLPVLQKLSPAYQVVLNLYVLEEYSHEEIAKKLNITASTSRSNLSRALLKLRELLESQVKPFIKTR